MAKLVIAALVAVGLILNCSTVFARDKNGPQTDKEKINYSVGYQIGSDFLRQNIDIDKKMLFKGMEAALSSEQPVLTLQEMQATLIDLKKKIIAQEEAQAKKQAEQYHFESKLFFEENAKKNDVVVMPSGLQYKIITKGSGKKPRANDRVEVYYSSSLIDGTLLGEISADGDPAVFAVKDAIPGLREALQLMKEGAEWKLFIPDNLTYGDKSIMNERSVIFKLKLVAVQPAKVAEVVQ